MNALLLEPIGGISGDLFLGAVADLGVDLDKLSAFLEKAGLRGFALLREQAEQHGIHGTRVSVKLDEAPTHDHRAWSDIRSFLETLPAPVGATALSIFGALASAEAQIHGVSEDEVEFHEVGALDSIVDIVGAAWALAELGSPRVFSRPPPLGSGFTRGQHGVIPLPAPATLALLAGKPTLLEGKGELTTPTGAAILGACADFRLPAQLTPERTGYGVGHFVFEDRPNVLRATLGTVADTAQSVTVLEAHVDDATPQVLAHLVDRLFSAGALDAALAPLSMKKGRLGHRLTVVCRSAERAALTEIIFRESTTLGVRAYPVEREELERRSQEVETPWGKVRVKLGLLRGAIVNRAPEYDDCVALARSQTVPLKDILAAAQAAALRIG